ncbi:MAG: hypothetical protein NUV53_00990 [Patescibacteria group bacterium]|nr:hypothetical protein [Patescibacteria group bacterium]
MSSAIHWKAPEYEYREKGISWYWITMIVAVGFVALAAWQRNFLFGTFVVIAELLVLIWGHREPNIIEFSADEKELAINNTRYEWDEFSSFSVRESEKDLVFTFRPRGRIRIVLHVRVPQRHIGDFNALINEKVVHAQEDRSLVEVLEELLRF